MSSACSIPADQATDQPDVMRVGMNRANRVRIVSGRGPGWRAAMTTMCELSPQTSKGVVKTKRSAAAWRDGPHRDGAKRNLAGTCDQVRESTDVDRDVTAEREARTMIQTSLPNSQATRPYTTSATIDVSSSTLPWACGLPNSPTNGAT